MRNTIDPDSIQFIFENFPDRQTGKSNGWTIGYKNKTKEIVTDDVGKAIAVVMAERAKKEYHGQLVTPKGDPLTEVMRTGIKIDIAKLDQEVVKKKTNE